MAKKIIYKEQLDEIIRLVKKSRETGDVDFYSLALSKAGEIKLDSYSSIFIVELVCMIICFHKSKLELYQMLEILGFSVMSMEEAAKAVA